MNKSSREQILEATPELVKAGGTVSLESASREAGLSKPGLMYHFRTKEALMLALVDQAVDHWEHELALRLPSPAHNATPRERVLAYLDWSLSGEVDETDLVMLADPRLRAALTARWGERMRPWLEVPDDLSPDERGRLTAVRLLADGAWHADATGVFAPTPIERDHVRRVARMLLEVRQ